ncbi:MAG: transporter substrate-binding domain-containing protein, partial [Chloroflexi bacterium]|nr:transporter substrate-binding domain-containing protein [Chloroflexota bacterium]
MKVRMLLVISVLAVALTAVVACGDSGELDDANARIAELESELGDTKAMLSEAEAAAAATTGNRIQRIRDRGVLICGSRIDVAGYGALDDAGRNIGFDIDLCRAVAAAVLGDGEAIEVRPFTAAERGPALQAAEIDMMARTVTWTTSRDAQWGDYTYTTFYDGQGFMVPDDLLAADGSPVDSAHDLSGAAVCVIAGTTTELNMADFFRQNNYDYNPNVFEENDAARAAYLSGACDVFTNDRSQLAAIRSTFDNPGNHV